VLNLEQISHLVTGLLHCHYGRKFVVQLKLILLGDGNIFRVRVFLLLSYDVWLKGIWSLLQNKYFPGYQFKLNCSATFFVQVILPTVEGSFMWTEWITENVWTARLSISSSDHHKCSWKEIIRWYTGFITWRCRKFWSFQMGKDYSRNWIITCANVLSF